MEPKQKPGVATSEFWLAAAALLAHALVILGVIPPETDLQHTASSVSSGIVSIMLAIQYITGRNALKVGSPAATEGLQTLLALIQKGRIDPDAAREIEAAGPAQTKGETKAADQGPRKDLADADV